VIIYGLSSSHDDDTLCTLDAALCRHDDSVPPGERAGAVNAVVKYPHTTKLARRALVECSSSIRQAFIKHTSSWLDELTISSFKWCNKFIAKRSPSQNFEESNCFLKRTIPQRLLT